MTDLPPELRDRAARTAFNAYWETENRPDGWAERHWLAVVDAVAEVLAGHVGCEHLDGPYRRLVVERDDLRARAERAEADLARARNLASEVLHLMRFRRAGRPVSIGEAHTLIVWSRGVLAAGPAGAAHTEEETELREEDLLVEHFDVPDQSVIDESGRGVRLTHTPSGVVVSSGAERTQLQNMAQCIELLRRELAARSVSPDHTGEN